MPGMKLQALEALAGAPESKEDEGLFSKIVQNPYIQKVLDYTDRPGAATRSAIHAYQKEEDPVEAFKTGLINTSSQAPTGEDIAQTFGKQHDIQNPYALTALATLADFADPTMFIPSGWISKAPKFLKAAEGVGKVVAKGAREASLIGKANVEARNAAELIKLKEILSNPQKYGHLPEFQQAIKKTGQVYLEDVPVLGKKIGTIE